MGNEGQEKLESKKKTLNDNKIKCGAESLAGTPDSAPRVLSPTLLVAKELFLLFLQSAIQWYQVNTEKQRENIKMAFRIGYEQEEHLEVRIYF